MTSLQAHDPAPADLAPDAAPLAVPVAPLRGWALADTGRRLAALAALPLTALLLALVLDGQPIGPLLLAWLALGPTTYYSLARVLRPEPRSRERTPRHLLAGAATSFGVPTAWCVGAGRGDDLVVLLGTPAFLLGVTTLVWGVVVFCVRLSQLR